jgi:hypothetical protein
MILPVRSFSKKMHIGTTIQWRWRERFPLPNTFGTSLVVAVAALVAKSQTILPRDLP